MKLLVSYLPRYRFVLLSLILLLLEVFHTFNGQWIGDFWEHSAVIRELATKPFSPSHPQLFTDAPHTFYSPYSLGIALISRITDLNPVTALSIAGIVNLVLFLISLKIFVSLLLGREEVAFYTLLFTLLLWGDSPWEYSGFFHLQVLGYVLPYSSTFAASLAFIGLSMCISFVRSGNRLWLIPILVIAVLVLLTHPLTFIVLSVGLVSISVGLRYLSLIDYVLLLGIFIFSLLVAAIWPYYPFVKLVLSESLVYHQNNRTMYVKVVERTFPALIGLPLILLRIKSNWRDPLGLMTLGLGLVYAYGALSGKWSYGRVVSYLVLLLHMVIADGVSQIESKLSRRDFARPGFGNSFRVILDLLRPKSPQPAISRFAYLCLILMVLFILSFNRSIWPTLQRSMPSRQNTFGRYTFLSDFTRQYDIVLSDIKTSWIVPTFGGKVVAVPHPLAFVPDHETRRKDVKYFFSDLAFYDARLEIIKRYKVDYLLLNKDRVAKWQTIMRSLQPLSDIVFSNDEFVLIDLRSLDEASTSRRLLQYPLPEPPTGRTRPQHAQVARFGGEIELLGYDVDWTNPVDASDAQPGSTVRVTLYWHAMCPMDTRYTVFVHLLDANSEIRGQWDGQPLNGTYPTDVWPSSVVVRDEYIVPVASDAPPGEYQLAVGLYELATMNRLPIFDRQGSRLAGDRLILDSMLILK